MNGRTSPRLPSEMSEEQQLAVAIAHFRPLDRPLPPGFEVESLPVYRAPISHSGLAVDEPPTPLITSAEESEPASGAVEGPTTAQDTPEAQTQTCHWATCSKTFYGFNAPTLLHVRHPALSDLLLPRD